MRRQAATATAAAELEYERASTVPGGELHVTGRADAHSTLLREGVVRLANALPEVVFRDWIVTVQ